MWAYDAGRSPDLFVSRLMIVNEGEKFPACSVREKNIHSQKERDPGMRKTWDTLLDFMERIPGGEDQGLSEKFCEGELELMGKKWGRA